MSPSTEPHDGQREFAAEVLHNLLERIAIKNSENADMGHYVYDVSHAWSDGSFIYVVYETPPLDVVWGLIRDTRESLIDPGPWNAADDPALYYYLLDFEEGWSAPSRPPEKGADIIHWRGDERQGDPARLSDVPDSYRHTPTPVLAARKSQEAPPLTEPRRYADPS